MRRANLGNVICTLGNVGTAKELLTALDKVERAGMTVQQLRSLHHWSAALAPSRLTFASVRANFEKGQELSYSNSRFSFRLVYVADRLPVNIPTLVAEALRRYPL